MPPANTPAGASPNFTPAYKNTVLWLLVGAYTFNFIDRTIISTIGQAIKVDLQLSDQQLGWLGGLSFALLYTALGIPIARLAERKSRVNIIAISIVIWSAFTALCGTATSYIHLLLYRVGVGVGEAGLSPPAHSLISDYFEPKKRASALSIYAFGIPLGTMFGAMAGGWIAENISWQAAFMMVGLPGVLVAVAIKMFVKEPPRGWSDRQAPLAAEPPAALGQEASVAGAPAEGPARAADPPPPSSRWPNACSARGACSTWSPASPWPASPATALATTHPPISSASSAWGWVLWAWPSA